MKLKYLHVNVFTSKILSGNGLIIFYNCPSDIHGKILLQITREMRQFESIFLWRVDENNYTARIFTMDEELDFAGHPVLGAAAAFHYLHKQPLNTMQWKISVKQRELIVHTSVNKKNYFATMNQGKPLFIHTASTTECTQILQALNLKPDNLYPELPIEVVSTGLPHLIVPLKYGIEHAKIVNKQFELLLQSMGAKFVYVFDILNREGRTWDNTGTCEDIATGSAAGPAGAYLHRHKLIKNKVIIHQGRFVNRPSQMEVFIESDKNHISSINVSGEVTIFAHGEIFDFNL